MISITHQRDGAHTLPCNCNTLRVKENESSVLCLTDPGSVHPSHLVTIVTLSRGSDQGRLVRVSLRFLSSNRANPVQFGNLCVLPRNSSKHQGLVSINTNPCDGIRSVTDAFFTSCISGGESFAAARSFSICCFVGYRGEPMAS